MADVTQLEGYDLKRLMRTGTVATIDNRNWELRDQSGPVQRLSQSRAIALDMESATIAANGFMQMMESLALGSPVRTGRDLRGAARRGDDRRIRHGDAVLRDAERTPRLTE